METVKMNEKQTFVYKNGRFEEVVVDIEGKLFYFSKEQIDEYFKEGFLEDESCYYINESNTLTLELFPKDFRQMLDVLRG